jgi:hypothetical protein
VKASGKSLKNFLLLKEAPTKLLLKKTSGLKKPLASGCQVRRELRLSTLITYGARLNFPISYPSLIKTTRLYLFV